MQAPSNSQKSEHVESQQSRPEAVVGDKRPIQSRLGRQEARPKAILGAKRLVRRPSWTPGGPSGGHLGRQKARSEAVLDARRPVQRPSWSPEGSFVGRLGRQEARMQVLLQFCCNVQVLRSWQQEARLQHRAVTAKPP